MTDLYKSLLIYGITYLPYLDGKEVGFGAA